MKILLINNYHLPVPPVKGGAVENLIDFYLKYNEKTRKHQITVYGCYDELASVESQKYCYTNFHFIKFGNYVDVFQRGVRYILNKILPMQINNAYISKVLSDIKDFNEYDTIIIENKPEYVLSIPKSYKGKIVLHLHNDWLNRNTKQAEKILDRCYEVYAISGSLKKCVDEIKDTNKVAVLYNGISLDNINVKCNREEIRDKYNLHADDIVITIVSRIVPEKGVLELAQAFNNIKTAQSIKLLIVGGTNYSEFEENTYTKQLKNNSNQNIIFSGYVDYSKMYEIYKVTDIGVVPSLFNDPFNLTSIEFLANGIPTVISDMGAMKELTNNKASIIVETNGTFIKNLTNALEILLENADIRRTMGEEGIKIAMQFSLKNYCNRLDEFLYKIGVNA